MTESLATTFSETLRHECAEDWQAATGHRFVTELCAGTVPDRVMAAYLVWAGLDLPGGAFQAGTVLAGGLLVAGMGGTIGLPSSDQPLLRAALVLGPVVFLAIGLAGVAALAGWAASAAFRLFRS